MSESDEGTVSVSDHIPPTLPPSNAYPEVICRPKNSKKGPYDFDQLRVVQEFDKEHTGAVWCLKFRQRSIFEEVKVSELAYFKEGTRFETRKNSFG